MNLHASDLTQTLHMPHVNAVELRSQLQHQASQYRIGFKHYLLAQVCGQLSTSPGCVLVRTGDDVRDNISPGS